MLKGKDHQALAVPCCFSLFATAQRNTDREMGNAFVWDVWRCGVALWGVRGRGMWRQEVTARPKDGLHYALLHLRMLSRPPHQMDSPGPPQYTKIVLGSPPPPRLLYPLFLRIFHM